MPAQYQLLITFPSVHYAIRAEKELRDRGIEVKTIPTPREISASCGLCLLLDEKHAQAIETGDIPIEREALYRYDRIERKSTKRAD